MRKLSAICFAFLMCLSVGATFYTNDITGGTTRASVLAAMAFATNGDTVFIKDGTYPITATITQSFAFTVSGTSSNNTIWLDAIPNANRGSGFRGVIRYGSGVTNFVTRLTNIKIMGDGTNNINTAGGILAGDLRGQQYVFDHIWMDHIHARVSNFFDNSTNGNFGGLFKYCTFTEMGSHGSFWDINTANGYYPWSHPLVYGSTNGWWYIEDCYASNSVGAAFTDCRGGTRLAVRSNIFENVSVENHELDHQKLGPLALEVYGNTFTGTNPAGKSAVFIRAGTALITGNTVGSSWPRLLNMVNYRSLSHTGSSSSGDSWGLFGPASGTNIWDDNYSGPYGLSTNITGTVSGAPTNASNQILVDTNVFWGTNDYWKGVSVINTTSGRGGLISASTSNTITLYAPLKPEGGPTYFTNGNTYKIAQVRQAFEQPGAGPGSALCCGTVTINPTPPGWPNESTLPIYHWNNTNITTVSPDVYGKLIVNGVHYTNAPAPGWVPLVYPHPLWSFIQGTTPDPNPTITSVADQTIGVSTNTGTLSFTIGSGLTNVANYVMTYTSTLTSLVPNAATNVVFGGSGASRTVKIYPITGQSGSTTIALIVTDEKGNHGSTTFLLTVATGNTPPNITPIDNQNINTASSTSALPFMVDDFESNATNLVVTRLSSNTSIIALANVVLAGTSTNRSVAVTSGTNIGFSTITLTVTDPGGKTNYTQFLVTVSPPAPSGQLFRGAYRRRPPF